MELRRVEPRASQTNERRDGGVVENRAQHTSLGEWGERAPSLIRVHRIEAREKGLYGTVRGSSERGVHSIIESKGDHDF